MNVKGSFSNPVQIIFSEDAVRDLINTLKGRRFLLVTSPGMVTRGLVGRIESAAGTLLSGVFTRIEPNPTIASVDQAVASLKNIKAECIVALGGGSAMDSAKAIAAVRSPELKPNWLSDHLRNQTPFPEDFKPSPIIMIPTTSGTGSEVTMWGTVWDEVSGKKYSIAHRKLYPEVALMDPRLTVSVPEEVTVSTALDALSHAMEAIWNKSSNPVSDMFAARAISMIPKALLSVLSQPTDLKGRSDLQMASLFAGLASSNTKTALAHSISYPLTSEKRMPHGFACSLTLAEILRVNFAVNPERVGLISKAFGLEKTDVDAVVNFVYDFFDKIELGKWIKQYVASSTEITGLKGTLIAPGRAENNLANVDQSQAVKILNQAYRRLC